MKDWNYYTKPTSTYYGFHEIAKAMEDNINNQKLTRKEYDEAMAKVKQKTREKLSSLNKPYYEEVDRLQKEFWEDARAELGYTQWMSERAIAATEHYAHQRGHSSGYSEIFNELSSIVEYASVFNR